MGIASLNNNQNKQRNNCPLLGISNIVSTKDLIKLLLENQMEQSAQSALWIVAEELLENPSHCFVTELRKNCVVGYRKCLA